MPRESRLQRRLRDAREVTDPGGKKLAEWARSMNGNTVDCVTVNPYIDSFEKPMGATAVNRDNAN